MKRKKGIYILTGSSIPDDNSEWHNGAGRFATIEMKNFLLEEMGKSSKNVNIFSLFAKKYSVPSFGNFDEKQHYECVKKSHSIVQRWFLR
ncbi:MAG: hypothetical protein LBB39_00565 [Mycoplasmataceae bacterium]|jgi:hypothetical protein|nr:hypothetical protein [Mycoplasmataceae bacterium]